MTTNVTDTDRDSQRVALRRRTLTWVVTIATLGLIFDGYDLVVYGAVLPRFLKDHSQIGQVTPALGGALGSFALIGVLVGALAAGSVGDIVGRRKVMLVAYAWFAVGMGATALVSSTAAFGLLRFLTGIGVGALVGTTGALVAEFAPPGKKNLCNAISYSGVPLGKFVGLLAFDPPARIDRLARHVLDRCTPAGHAPAVGLLQDAGVTGVARLPRPDGRGDRTG